MSLAQRLRVISINQWLQVQCLPPINEEPGKFITINQGQTMFKKKVSLDSQIFGHKLPQKKRNFKNTFYSKSLKSNKIQIHSLFRSAHILVAQFNHRVARS